jgi:hypothetical protein
MILYNTEIIFLKLPSYFNILSFINTDWLRLLTNQLATVNEAHGTVSYC